QPPDTRPCRRPSSTATAPRSRSREQARGTAPTPDREPRGRPSEHLLSLGLPPIGRAGLPAVERRRRRLLRATPLTGIGMPRPGTRLDQPHLLETLQCHIGRRLPPGTLRLATADLPADSRRGHPLLAEHPQHPAHVER